MSNIEDVKHIINFLRDNEMETGHKRGVEPLEEMVNEVETWREIQEFRKRFKNIDLEKDSISEEEKKAIWYCSEILDVNENDIEQWKIVENLINRLQKELEQEKEKNKLIKFDGAEFIKDSKGNLHIVTGGVVSKDKIRAKIKELEKQCETELLTTWLEAKIEVLKELLEGE